MSNDSSSTEASAFGSPTTMPEVRDRDWSGAVVPLYIVNGVFLAINIWVLMCTIIYGFKTNRWRKRPGTSSLTTGALYTSYVAAIALKLPSYALAQVWLYMGLHPMIITECELMIDCSIVVSIISLYGDYTFMWLVQRKILNHPYIKDRVNKYVDCFSRGMIVGITLLIFGLGLMFAIDSGNFQHKNIGCVPLAGVVNKLRGIGLVSSFCLVFIQIILLSMSMYAASRAIIPRASEGDCNGVEENPPCEDHSKLESHNCCQIFIKNVIRNANQEYPNSPIHMAVKRSAISCIVIIGTDLMYALISLFAFPPDAPIYFSSSLGFIQSSIHVFAMLAVFGFAGEVLTLCCPKAVTRVKRSRPGSLRAKAPEVVLTPPP